MILRSPRAGEIAFGSMVMHREDDENATMTEAQKQVMLDFANGTAGKYMLIPIEDPGAD